jgi:hypothetical protein
MSRQATANFGLTLFRYPVYSFFLPVYSFWKMDDFSWGNTRLVIGEGSNKKVVMNDDEKWDESMIPLKKFSGTSIRTSVTSHSNLTPIRIRSGNLGHGIPHD